MRNKNTNFKLKVIKYYIHDLLPFLFSKKKTLELFFFNQIVRSPGIYVEKNKNENSLISTIIPNQGSWLSLKLTMRVKAFDKELLKSKI